MWLMETILSKNDGHLKLHKEADIRLLKRFTAIKNTEYFIEESVYYRTHLVEFQNTKKVLWNADEECGKIRLYED